jgi:putative transposase
MNVTRSERHAIHKNHPMYKIIDDYCYKSKNLYNFANFLIRQEYLNNNNYIDYHTMWKNLKGEDVFRDIGSNSGQHTLKILHQNWKSFFAASKDYLNNNGKYLGKPKIPRYLKKEGRFIWVLTNMQSKVIDGMLVFSFKPIKKFNEVFKTKIQGKHMQTRFIPKGDYYVMEIVYEITVPEKSLIDERILGIDLGVSRFATVQNNFNQNPFSINGGGIKSINQYYNKKVSKIKSKLKKNGDQDWSKKLQAITNKRNNKIDHFMHCASKYIVDYCLAFKVDTVVIGYNQKWKQKSKLSKRNNQTFIHIPFYSFVSKLEYKLENVGIKILVTEESYTSKASFLDYDRLTRNDFSGKRIERGLYASSQNKLINADVNGASNIIKKVFPKAFVDGVEGVGLHPSIINI